MQVDLKAEIARIVYWKQVAAEQDKDLALPWHLPRVAASAESIALAERAVGVVLPDEYRNFLACADGWQGFYVLVDLFGTADFIKRRHEAVLRREDVAEFLNADQLSRSDVVVIGASDLDRDVFLLFSATSPLLPQGVIWLAGEEIDRFETFSEFLGSMVNYNAQIAQTLIDGSQAK